MITSQQSTIPVEVAAVDPVAPTVKTFTLTHADGRNLPHFSAGSHVVVTLPAGDRTFRNPYSLMSHPGDTSHYAISVRREDGGRGGSRYLHEHVQPGDRLEISAPVNLFALHTLARHHVLIAGGIGITPMLAHLEETRQRTLSCELHYQFRGIDNAPFRAQIAEQHGARATFHDSARGQYLDPHAVLRHQPLGTHVYVCGPESLIQAVRDATARLGWPSSHVHSEAFTAPPPGRPFTLVLGRSGREIPVPAEFSALEALEQAGLEPACSCRGGVCGACENTVLEGEIEHQDHFLSDDVKAAGTRMMICVSRARSDRVVLDL